MKLIYQIRGWVLIRPLRVLSRACVKGSFGLRLKIRRNEFYIPGYNGRYEWPNLHYWLLYKTVGKFSTWLYFNGWRFLCDWTGGYRRTYPLPARILHKIGQTLSYGFYGNECFHCAADEGDPGNISEEPNSIYFELTESGSNATEDGTDHWYRGITTCPKCGYKDTFSDSSL